MILVLESYEGDIDRGMRISVAAEGRKPIETEVRELAWGSAFNARRPPLTLVTGLPDGDPPDSGAEVRGVS